MPKLSGLIFDLDGTLIDSAPDLRRAINAMLAENGRRALNLEEVKRAVGDGMIPLITRAFQITGGVPENFNSYGCFQNFIAHYRDLDPDPVQIYPHVEETLKYYHSKGIKLGICTNKQEAATHHLMQQLGLDHYFGFRCRRRYLS